MQTNDSNMLYNMIIASAVSIVITNFSNCLMKLFDFLGNVIMQYFAKSKTSSKNKSKGQVTISSTGVINANGSSESSCLSYKAVLYKLNTKGINTKQIKIASSNFNPLWYDGFKCSEKLNMNIDHSDEIIISTKNDMRLNCTQTNEVLGEKESPAKFHNTNIHISSTKLTVPEILDKICSWEEKYLKYLKRYKHDGNLYYFYNTNTSEMPTNAKDDTKQTWGKHIMISNKTFDNVFFTEKSKLLHRLDYYLNNEDIYKRRGIPYNIGFLFYGYPGCGKTSCIKAIANYTKRHVVEVNLRCIKTCGEFIDIFMNEFINSTFIPTDKKIIVLEDIDCMLDIVKDRSSGENITDANKNDGSENDSISDSTSESSLKNSFMELICEKMLSETSAESYGPTKYQRDQRDGKLTLSCILNTIDGVLEQHGRILIITTNYKNKLDSALIRPGRIDMRIDFTKCTNQMTREIISHFYDETIPNDIKFPDNKYTPAELIEKCFNNDTSMMKAVNEICL